MSSSRIAFACTLLSATALGVACESSTLDTSDCGLACGGADDAPTGDDESSDGLASGGTGALPGNYTCPSGEVTTVEDQPGLALLPAVDPGMDVDFRTNHVGYSAQGAKRIVVEASGTLTRFQLVRASDQVPVFEGDLVASPSFTAWGSSDQHLLADFSAYRTPGSYVLRANGVNSEPFRIAADLLFEETIDEVLGYFTASRANDSEVWGADASVSKYGGGGSANVQGGWYDASGDISKYLSHLSYANFMNPQQIPLVAWSLAWVHERATQPLTTRGLADDVAAEAVWGADYLVRVLDADGYFYATIFDNWTGDLSQREICAFDGESGNKNANYQAAWREGGGMAIAALARIAGLGQSGDFTSAQYLEAAEKGFAHLLTHGEQYANDGKQNAIDDYTALLAATELFAATQDTSYLEHARTRALALGARMSTTGYFIADDGNRPLWHASDAGLPVVALVRYAELEPERESRRDALDVVARHLDYLVEVTTTVSNPYDYARQHVNVGASVQTSFFVPHQNETSYWWQGESARLASLAAATRIGRRALADEYGCTRALDEPAERFAAAQLDWILGKNPLDISFLNGFGRNNPPAYCGDKSENGFHVGGISNGITGEGNDGSGLQWMPNANSGEDCWRNWRWVEQWLPHSTWYMLAITAELP